MCAGCASPECARRGRDWLGLIRVSRRLSCGSAPLLLLSPVRTPWGRARDLGHAEGPFRRHRLRQTDEWSQRFCQTCESKTRAIRCSSCTAQQSRMARPLDCMAGCKGGGSRLADRIRLRPASHLFAGELGVAGVEAAAEEAAAVDQVEAEGEEHQALHRSAAYSVLRRSIDILAMRQVVLRRRACIHIWRVSFRYEGQVLAPSGDEGTLTCLNESALIEENRQLQRHDQRARCSLRQLPQRVTNGGKGRACNRRRPPGKGRQKS